MRRLARLGAVLAVALAATACARLDMPPGPGPTEPRVDGETFITRDGSRLPLRRFAPDGDVEAVILALHGFNDYGNAFRPPAPWFTRDGVLIVAPDQRGFGLAPHRSLWAGGDVMAADAADLARALRVRRPNTPLFLMGESMGGAVAMLAAADHGPPPVDGLVLVAPAVWGRSTLPWPARAMLSLGEALVPTMPVTGHRFRKWPTDNVPLLRKLSRDWRMLRYSRVATVGGLVDLMDAARMAAPRLPGPVLLLYGGNDQIIPAGPVRTVIDTLPETPGSAVKLYDTGWHMLLRDLNGERVAKDVVAWMRERAGARSGALAD